MSAESSSSNVQSPRAGHGRFGFSIASLARGKRRRAAFTMVEMISVISLIVVGAGVGTAVVSKVHSVAMDTKLAEDMEQVNSAIAVYLTGGGSLAGVTDAQAVLNKLKTVTTTENGADRQIMFAKRAMIDQRLAVVTSASSSERGFWKWSRQKARYNATTKRFEYAADSDPNAILGFALNETMGMAPTVAEQRSLALKQAKVESWVWDYDPNVAVAGGAPPDEVTIGGSIPPAIGGVSVPQATPPTSLPAPPQLVLASYPLSVALSHTNNPGMSRIIYVPPDGSSTGELYTSAIQVHPGGVVNAFVNSLDPSALTDSTMATFTYEPTPETLNFLDSLVANYSYFELGGALAPGSPAAPPFASPAISLNTGSAIPALYQHSDHFRVYYTLDGTDPANSPSRVPSPDFAGGYPGDAIGLTPSAFGAGSSATVRYVGISTAPQIVNNSTPVLRSTAARKSTLRAPLLSPAGGTIAGSVIVNMDFNLAASDMPANARIYYRLDGVDPGDQSGEPQAGAALYSGPVFLQPDPGQTITVVARVYPPTTAKNWFDTSVSATVSYTRQTDVLAYYGVNGTKNIYTINPVTGVTTVLTSTALYKTESIAFDGDNNLLYYIEDGGGDSKLGRYNISSGQHTDLGRLIGRPGFPYLISKETKILEFYKGSLYLIPEKTDDLVQIAVGSFGITNIQKAIDIPANGTDEALGSAIASDGTLYYTTKNKLLKFNLATLSGAATVKASMPETKAMLFNADTGKLYGPAKTDNERIDNFALADGAAVIGQITNPKIKFLGLAENSGARSTDTAVPAGLYACVGGNREIHKINVYDGSNSLYNAGAPFNIGALAYEDFEDVIYYLEQTSDPDVPCRLAKLNAAGTHSLLNNIALGWTYNPATHPQNLVAFGGCLYYITPGTDDLVRIELLSGGTGIAQQTKVADISGNTTTFANPGDLAVMRDGTFFFVNEGAASRLYRYNPASSGSYLDIGATAAPYPALAGVDGALYGARGSTTTIERLIINTAESETPVTTSPTRMFVDFASPTASETAVPSDSLWAIREEAGAGKARLVEFVNYKNLTNNVKAQDWGEIFHEDGASYKSFSAGGATTGISGMALTDDGDCYIVGNRSIIANGVTYARPLLRFRVPAAMRGDRIVAEVVGDLKTKLQTILGAAPSSTDRVTGLGISPADDELYAVVDRTTGSNTDLLLKIETMQVDGDVQLSTVTNLGSLTAGGDKSEMTEDMAFSNIGRLYVADTEDDLIYTVNPATGAILSKYSKQTDSNYVGLAMHPIHLDVVGSSTAGGLNNQMMKVVSADTNDSMFFNYQAQFGLTGIQAIAFFAYPLDFIPDPVTGAPPPAGTEPGVAGGHIDVDTSHLLYPFNKGSTDAHVHQYDDKHNTLEVNFFNMLSNLHNINTDITSGSQKFKIIIGNPSLSSAAKVLINQTSTVGSEKINKGVEDYADTPVASLPIYSFDGIAGTIKLRDAKLVVDVNAINQGNMIGTVTGAVRANRPGKLGEWRNGALTVQAVTVKASGADGFTTNPAISNGGEQGIATSGLLWETTIFHHHRGPAYDQQGGGTFAVDCEPAPGDSTLDPPATFDYVTQADGVWNAAATWVGGSIPAWDDITNKKVSINHQVTLSSGNVKVRSGGIMVVQNGSLTVPNGSFDVENSGKLLVTNSIFRTKNEFKQVANTIVYFANSTVDIGSELPRSFLSGGASSAANFNNDGGYRRLEDVALNVTKDYINSGVDVLIRVHADIGDKGSADGASDSEDAGKFANSSGASVQLSVYDCEFYIADGNFENSSRLDVCAGDFRLTDGTFDNKGGGVITAVGGTGKDLVIWINNASSGDIKNSGTWQASSVRKWRTDGAETPDGLTGIIKETKYDDIVIEFDP